MPQQPMRDIYGLGLPGKAFSLLPQVSICPFLLHPVSRGSLRSPPYILLHTMWRDDKHSRYQNFKGAKSKHLEYTK